MARQRPEPVPRRFFDATLYLLWVLSFNCAALAAVELDTYLPKGTTRVSVLFVLAAVFLVDGWYLVSDSMQARQRLLLRLVHGRRRRHPETRGWRRVLARLGQGPLTLIGLVWLTLGVWELVRVASDL